MMIFLGVVMMSGAMGQGMKPKAQSKTLKITVEGVSDAEKARINSTYPINANGLITMWKIGRIDTKEKTIEQLEKKIAAAYRRAEIYDRPVFRIAGPFVRGGGKFVSYSVGGQVKKAGRYQWKKGETLGHAVEMAGGATPYGATGRVKLYRNGKVYVYNLGVKKHANVKIYHGDLIEVPQRIAVPKPAGK